MKNYNELLAENKAWAQQVFEAIDKKQQAVTVRSRGKLVDGVGPDGRHKSVNPTAWTSGFFGGMNVLLWNYTKNEEYLTTAKVCEKMLDGAFERYEDFHHDVGFMWHILSGAIYRLTGDEASKKRNLFTASTLFSRYILSGGFIRAWNGGKRKWSDRPSVENWSIIDCLMNLPSLYWASEVIGDDRFKQIAMSHADMALCDHLRPDGSVVHIVEHDRETGEAVQHIFGQGIAPESSWSRGQAWALYGFVISYKHTGEQRYLDAAKQVANYFIANCCDDWIPRIDFRAPSQPVYYDTSAGCCAACGLIELAKLLPEHEGGAFMNAALNMLKAIWDSFGDADPETDVMIDHASLRYPAPGVFTPESAGVHIPIIYTEYFFVEAILKLLGSEFFPW
jgi:unsaturated chondroitin disaccharide hydrolase